jgi:double zinc ribbon protein
MEDRGMVLAQFHAVLVAEIRDQRPEYLSGPFTVAEIYQNLVPYGSHRDRLGVEMNGDYEDALLRLLAGEGGFLILDSDAALQNLREELDSSNPNTGLYREFAAVDVRLNPMFVGGAPVAMSNAGPAPDDVLELIHAGRSPKVAELEVHEEPVTMSMDELAPRAEPAADDLFGETDVDDTPLHETAAMAQSGSVPSACRWCRADLPQHDKLNFCPFCGQDVHVVPCQNCGEELEPAWSFCLACGTEVAG